MVIAWKKATDKKKTLISYVLGNVWRVHSRMGTVNFSGVFVVWFLSAILSESAILSGSESTAVRDKVQDALESNGTQSMMHSLHIGATFKVRSALDNTWINTFSVSGASVQTPVFPPAFLTLKRHILNPKTMSPVLVTVPGPSHSNINGNPWNTFSSHWQSKHN